MPVPDLASLLVKGGFLKTPRIIRAFRHVDRRHFVLDPSTAYIDAPFPIPGGQTISAPHMLAIMLELLQPTKKHRVLEVGAGSGYAAALLGFLAKEVYAIEHIEELFFFAKQNLQKTGIEQVTILHGDGSLGYPPAAPYDRILFSCGATHIPPAAVEQLSDPGIMVIPVGDQIQHLIVVKKRNGHIMEEDHGECVFVPMT